MGIAMTIEPESAGLPAATFRLMINGRVIAEGLTVSQAHFVVSEALLRMAYPQSAEDGPGAASGRIRARPRPRLPRASTLQLAAVAA